MKIGLVLSGGGTRAAVFHLGVLKRLAEAKKLEDVSHISTVSGGSLITALIFSHSSMIWPTSDSYLNDVYPKLKNLLSTTDLFTAKVLLFSPLQWIHIFHRARIVANLAKSRWGIDGCLKDLPDKPIWEINATSFETGRNWYFSKYHMGDWVYGDHDQPPFSIAEASAASAAVPYALGALKLKMPKEGWKKSTYPSTKQLDIRPHNLRLWDGGVYENLGLERLSKPGKDMKGCDFIIISDASAPLRLDQNSILKKLILTPWRIIRGKLAGPRLFDVASEQIRSIRIRAFWSDLSNPNCNTTGIHIRIGNPVRQVDSESKKQRSEDEYDKYQNENEVKQAALHETTLGKLDIGDFDRVSRHGYEAAEAILEGYAPSVL